MTLIETLLWSLYLAGAVMILIAFLSFVTWENALAYFGWGYVIRLAAGLAMIPWVGYIIGWGK